MRNMFNYIIVLLCILSICTIRINNNHLPRDRIAPHIKPLSSRVLSRIIKSIGSTGIMFEYKIDSYRREYTECLLIIYKNNPLFEDTMVRDLTGYSASLIEKLRKEVSSNDGLIARRSNYCYAFINTVTYLRSSLTIKKKDILPKVNLYGVVTYETITDLKNIFINSVLREETNRLYLLEYSFAHVLPYLEQNLFHHYIAEVNDLYHTIIDADELNLKDQLVVKPIPVFKIDGSPRNLFIDVNDVKKVYAAGLRSRNIYPDWFIAYASGYPINEIGSITLASEYTNEVFNSIIYAIQFIFAAVDKSENGKTYNFIKTNLGFSLSETSLMFYAYRHVSKFDFFQMTNIEHLIRVDALHHISDNELSAKHLLDLRLIQSVRNFQNNKYLILSTTNFGYLVPKELFTLDGVCSWYEDGQSFEPVKFKDCLKVYLDSLKPRKNAFYENLHDDHNPPTLAFKSKLTKLEAFANFIDTNNDPNDASFKSDLSALNDYIAEINKKLTLSSSKIGNSWWRPWALFKR